MSDAFIVFAFVPDCEAKSLCPHACRDVLMILLNRLGSLLRRRVKQIDEFDGCASIERTDDECSENVYSRSIHVRSGLVYSDVQVGQHTGQVNRDCLDISILGDTHFES